MENEKIIVGLDIGTTKICAIVGRKNEYGKLEVLGMGKAGIRFAVAMLCIASTTVPAASAGRNSIELAAARIVGKHGLGVDITENTRQVDPLHWAAINDQPETIARVIESGVPVDLRDGQGRTALMVAAAFGNATAARH